MSGGSYNYICYVELGDILNRIEDAESMVGRLKELEAKEFKGADYVARMTEGFLTDLREVEKRFRRRLEDLQEVWKAVEWYDSGDSGVDSVKVALEEYCGKRGF